MSQDAHELMPAAIAALIPPLYATEAEADPMVWVKFFTPASGWTWYVTEVDPDERLCFGLVIGQDQELGYFSLDELEEVRDSLGLRVERDLYFEPQPLSAIQRKHA